VIEPNIRQKIENLILRARQLDSIPGGMARDGREIALCAAWITEALNVVELAVPSPTKAYRQRVETMAKGSGGVLQSVKSMASTLEGLLTDIDAGLLGDLYNKIAAETYDDFLDHAEEYLRRNKQMEAGVIAGVVFEDTIRRICRNQGREDRDKPLEDLINLLAKENVISGQQSKQAKVASHVRTKATHALWDEFDREGVADTIKITRLLLQEHLGG
jgi:hypothetical protein